MNGYDVAVTLIGLIGWAAEWVVIGACVTLGAVLMAALLGVDRWVRHTRSIHHPIDPPA